MKVLCVGDVCGENGCNYLRRTLPNFKREHKIDFTIVNGENSFNGKGITPKSANSIFDSGADVITTGNHAFGRFESYSYYDSSENLIRPANYPKAAPGRGYTVIDMLKYKVCVINLLGTMFLEPLDDPFRVIDGILEKTKDCRIRILDFHAEATSEKRAMGFYLDGRVTALFGTHTHIPTADETVLPNGTGYITDVGMTGVENSVLGVKKENAIEKFRTRMPVKFDCADGKCKMDCVIFEVDTKTGLAVSAERFTVR